MKIYTVVRKGSIEEESGTFTSFEQAQSECQSWINYDHERKDHEPTEAPSEPDVNVCDGDYTYIIREAEV